MDNRQDILEYKLAVRDQQVAELSERLRRVDVSYTIRHSILNCITNSDLMSHFSEIENIEDMDGLTAIVNKLVAVAVNCTTIKDIDKALKIYKFLFKYSFSAAPTRMESITADVNREFLNMQSKLERLHELKVQEAEVVDV